MSLHVLDHTSLHLDAHFVGNDIPALYSREPADETAGHGLRAPSSVNQRTMIRIVQALLLLDLRATEGEDLFDRRNARLDAFEHLPAQEDAPLAGSPHATRRPLDARGEAGDHPRGGATEYGTESGAGGQQQQGYRHEQEALQPGIVAELHLQVLRNRALGGSQEERDHLRGLESLAEASDAGGRIDLRDAQ